MYNPKRPRIESVWRWSTLITFTCIMLWSTALVGLGYIVYSHTAVPVVVPNELDAMAQVRVVIDEFAHTFTRRDIAGNVNLFTTSGMANFRSVFPEFNIAPINRTVHADPGVGAYVTDLESLFIAYLSSHLLIGNPNITVSSDLLAAEALCIAFFTRTIDDMDSVPEFKTYYYSFSMQFFMARETLTAPWLITYAHTLVNATKTEFIDNYLGSISGPATFDKRNQKRNGDLTVWQNLLSHINNLIAVGQLENARAVCRTQMYQWLASQFDESHGEDQSCFCNTPHHIRTITLSTIRVCIPGAYIDKSCIHDSLGIRSINGIEPSNRDFSLVPGDGITLVNTTNGFVISTDGPPCGHTVITAGDGITITNTTGGYVISTYGTHPAFMAGDGITISTTTDGYVISITPQLVGAPNITLNAPPDLFSVINGDTITVVPQLGNQVWAGPASGAMGDPGFRYLEPADLPSINVSLLSGVLAPQHGGTGNGAPLSGNRFMVSNSNGSSIEEFTALNEGDILIGGTNGGPPFGATLVAGTGISIEYGASNITISTTFGAQASGTFFAGPIGDAPMDVPTFRTISTSDLPSVQQQLGGVPLPLGQGGTGTNASAFVGGHLIMSTLMGDALMEGSLVGHNGIVVVNTTTIGLGGTCSTKLDSTCMSNTIVATTITVSGSTYLGTATSCVTPLGSSCYDISGQQCTTPLDSSCVSPDLVLNSLTINELVLLNTSSAIIVQTSNVQYLESNHTLFLGPVQCAANGTISQDCYDISGKTCTESLAESCIPDSMIFINMEATNTLTINNAICNTELPDSCMPTRVKTINGITQLDFIITGGTAISVTPTDGGGGITIDNTGVTSVALSVPSEFSVSGTPVNGSGTLSITKGTQNANTVWAGPIVGSPEVPTFRALTTSDLPSLLDGELYIGSTGGVPIVGTLTAGSGISITMGTATFMINATTAAVSGSNVNVGGVGVFKQVGASSLEFRGINGASNRLSVTLDAPNNEIDLDVVTANVDHDGLLNYAANRHIDHSSVSIVAGMGLTGGGDITSSRTLDLANTAVTPGTYGGQFTVDAHGRIIDASNVTFISVALAAPVEFTVSGSPVTSSGTLTFTKATQSANTVWAGPMAGGPAAPTFRALVLGDMPALTNGQLYIGSGGTPTVASLTAGTGITITPGAGSITISTNGNASTILGDVTGTLEASTVSTVGTSSAALVHSAELLANAATDSNTAGTIVKRSAGGSFSATLIETIGALAASSVFKARVSGDGSERFAIAADGGMAWNSDSTFFRSAVNRLRTNGEFQALHYLCVSGTPTAVSGAGAGIGGSVSVTGNDSGMQVTVNTGLLPVLSATIFTLTYATPYSSATTYPVFSPASSSAALLSGTSMVHVSAASSTTFTFRSGTIGLIATTTFVWNFSVQA